ncbi:MAG TPA: hypothetical protein PLN86_16915 [Candidatus Hydrogenedentes bacterium]|nr:hypothetical protein [Candidatus Hydrogenedentota bacterium]
MNFLQMKQDLADRLSSFDETISADATRLGRWINRAQDNICLAWNWPFNRQLDIIQTVPDYSTGTLNISSNTSTITFSATPLVSFQHKFIKFGSQSDWYEIVSHTVGETTAVIGQNYPGSTITGGTFLIRKFRYELTGNALTVIDVKIASNFKNLISLSPMMTDMMVQMTSGTGTPTAYFLTSPASDGSPQIGFFPNADAVYNIYVEEKFETTEMVSDSDTSIIPSPYHDSIVTLASYYGFLKINSLDRAAMVFKEFNESMEEMKKVYTQDAGRNRVMRPIDGKYGSDTPGPSLPPQYGPMSYR